jgi:hypothetical protein
MLYWIFKRVLRRGFKSRRGIVRLTQLENLARSGTAAWSVAQEQARLGYLAAKEAYERSRSWRSFQNLMEHLLQLHSTNAVVQSLLNEHVLEQLMARAPQETGTGAAPAARRCA